MFGLAINGKVNADGMPTNLLHVTLLLKKGGIVLVGIPLVLQALLINTLAQIAQIVGTERSLHKYWSRSKRGAQ